MNKALFSSDSDEWRTPAEVIKLVRFVMPEGKIELDPCSCEKSFVNPEREFRKEDNGLAKQWIANSVFVNFPYSENKKWSDKIIEEYATGRAKTVVVLCAARTDTKWFQNLAMCASAFLFFKGRLKFLPEQAATKGNTAPFPSALIALGDFSMPNFGMLDKHGIILYPQ